jgi:hypothetical protein
VEVAEALPAWIDLGMWIGWPFAVMVLFAIHQVLIRRRLRSHRGSPAGRAGVDP